MVSFIPTKRIDRIMSKQILTIGDAAEILGVTDETLRAWELSSL